jgi:peptidoglycan hydrolase-like protein with peptidoglycan-binding domain
METWFACSDFDICAATQTSPVSDQVRISRSVGVGGTNLSEDVGTIQKSLNRIPTSQGGPSPPLKVDGFIGPLTTAAIRQFQKIQFPGWTPDARVDPGGKPSPGSTPC